MTGVGVAAPSSGAAGMSPAAGSGAGGTGPNPISTEHPSILPLRLEAGRITFGGGDAATEALPVEGTLVDKLAATFAPNPRDSPPNALVFGVASQSGPVSQLDAVVGSVGGARRRAVQLGSWAVRLDAPLSSSAANERPQRVLRISESGLLGQP